MSGLTKGFPQNHFQRPIKHGVTLPPWSGCLLSVLVTPALPSLPVCDTPSGVRTGQPDGGSAAPEPAAAAAQTSPTGSSVFCSAAALQLSGLRAECPTSHRSWVVAHARLPSAVSALYRDSE